MEQGPLDFLLGLKRRLAGPQSYPEEAGGEGKCNLLHHPLRRGRGGSATHGRVRFSDLLPPSKTGYQASVKQFPLGDLKGRRGHQGRRLDVSAEEAFPRNSESLDSSGGWISVYPLSK